MASAITRTTFSKIKLHMAMNIAKRKTGYPSHISTDTDSPGVLWCSFEPAKEVCVDSSLGGSVVMWGIWCFTVPSRSLTNLVVWWLRPWWLAVTWVAPLCRMKLGGFLWFRWPMDVTPTEVFVVSERTAIKSSVWPVFLVSPVWDSIYKYVS